MQDSNTTLSEKMNLKEFLSSVKLALKRIRFHSKEIVACVLLGFLFSKVDKAQQFFSSFASAIEGQEGTIWQFLFIFIGNGVAVIWLSYVFWHKPKKMRPKWVKRILGFQDEASLNIYQEYYKKPEALWWLAAVSSMPVLLTSLALSVALMKGNDLTGGKSVFGLIENNPGTTFIVATLIYFIFALLAKPKVPGDARHDYFLKKCRAYALIFLGFAVGYGFIFWFYSDLGLSGSPFFEFSILAIFVFMPAMLAARFWFMSSKSLQKMTTDEDGNRLYEGEDCAKAESVNEFFRATSYIVSVIFFVVSAFYAITTTLWFSSIFFPIAVVLFVFIFYFQVADFLVYNMTKKRFWLAVGVVALLVLFRPNGSHYEMKFNDATGVTFEDRVDVEEYYLRWLGKHMDADTSVVNPSFYLVASEGGGSRSGGWTSSVLTRLDKKSNGVFRERCFAISTVSGGTVGTAATISLWDAGNKKGLKGAELYEQEIKENKPTKEQEYIQRVFRRNYVSSAILGLFFHDFIQSVPIVNLIYFKNYSRSDKHQEEENDAVCRGLTEYFGEQEDGFKDFYKSDFLSLYYDENKKVKTDLPLFFPNTARVEDGRRGVLSPVQNSVETITGASEDYDTTNLFVNGVDVIGVAGAESPGKSIRFSGAVSLSQLFPYVNSTIKVGDKTGRYMDGGAYENMGLTTIGEIYRKLCFINQSPDTVLIKKLYPTKSVAEIKEYMQRIDFKLIMIFNSKVEEKSELEKPGGGIQLLDPLAGLLATPFSGHTEHMYWQTIQEFSNGCSPYDKGNAKANNRIFKFPLIEDVKKKEIVMSRWLSQPEMNLIFERAEIQVEELGDEILK